MPDDTYNPTLPAADEVHVWAVPLDARATPQPDTAAECLSPEERERASCFSRDDLRRRFVVTRAAVREILSRYLNVEPSELSFKYGPHGKPRLTDVTSSLQFNLTHSGELALVAATCGGPVGVDVERLRTVRHLEQLAERYFTPAETAAILAADDSKQTALFFHFWTAKEAILKGLGRGLTFPLHRVQIATGDERQLVRIADLTEDHSDWWIEPIEVETGYFAAVATSSPTESCSLRRYPVDLE